MTQGLNHGLGWQRDLPDCRDFTLESPAVARILQQLRPMEVRHPAVVDLREFFPDAYDQRHLNSSSSQSCVGLIAYFMRRCRCDLTELSRLFHYQMTCGLLDLPANANTDLRTCCKALARFGLPPERYWPYVPDCFFAKPGPQLFSYVDGFRGLSYFRLDKRNCTGRQTLHRVKALLAANIPVAFGFSMPSLFSDDGCFSYRPELHCPLGGQAMVAVGYDEKYRMATRGALLVRNSWGAGWGDRGYGWMPYEFVIEQLASDFWTILHPEWIECDELLRPAIDA